MNGKDNFLKELFTTCERIPKPRTPLRVLTSVIEECGELGTEIGIACGHKDREASPDGIIGEAIDLILAAGDIIWLQARREKLDMTELSALIERRAKRKLEKWETGVAKANERRKRKTTNQR